MNTAVIIVDHGSTNAAANGMLLDLSDRFARHWMHRYAIVEPAHMELAEPTIAQAYARCVLRGADRIIVCPFFLGPGKHWRVDIPRLVEESAKRFPGVEHRIANPLGIDRLMIRLLGKRASECIAAKEYFHASGT